MPMTLAAKTLILSHLLNEAQDMGSMAVFTVMLKHTNSSHCEIVCVLSMKTPQMLGIWEVAWYWEGDLSGGRLRQNSGEGSK